MDLLQLDTSRSAKKHSGRLVGTTLKLDFTGMRDDGRALSVSQHQLSNILKKPQRVGIRQFTQRIEQLNTYVVQLPCWYYSPSYNVSMMPANVSFTKADLASHVLRMCPHQWQDQYNLQEKGMTPMDMHSL